MKRFCFCVLCVFLVWSMSASARDGGGWQKISNRFYSLEVPSDWRSESGSLEMVPGEREARGFKIRYLAWRKPTTYKERIESINLMIQSYSRPGGAPASISEMEKLLIINASSKEMISDSGTEKIYSVIKKSKEMDGSIVAFRRFYLFSEKEGQVHVLEVSTTDSYYQSRLETRLIIKKILDSFKLE